MPLVNRADLIIAAVPNREDPRDVLISPTAPRISELASQAKVGTGSLPPPLPILALRPDLQGGIDPWKYRHALHKLTGGGAVDAICLAFSGLRRLPCLIPPT